MFYMRIVENIRKVFLPVFIMTVIVVVIVIAFLKYYIFADFDIMFRVSCQSVAEVSECVSDGEKQYVKVLVAANKVEEWCYDGDIICMQGLANTEHATILSCEEYLESEEYCVKKI